MLQVFISPVCGKKYARICPSLKFGLTNVCSVWALKENVSLADRVSSSNQKNSVTPNFLSSQC